MKNDDPTPIVLCGATSTHGLIESETAHYCNKRIEGNDNTVHQHLGEHHCGNCGAGFIVHAEPTHTVQGGTLFAGTDSHEGLPTQSIFSLSGGGGAFGALDDLVADVRSRFDQLERRADVFGSVQGRHARALDGHDARLADRKADYDALIERVKVLTHELDAYRTLYGNVVTDVQAWKSYANRRFDEVNKSMAAMRVQLSSSADAQYALKRAEGERDEARTALAEDVAKLRAAVAGHTEDVRGLDARLGDVEAAIMDGALEDVGVDDVEDVRYAPADWCPARTGVITEAKRPTPDHSLHECIKAGAGHAVHKCACGSEWYSATKPSESVVDETDARGVPGVPVMLESRSASLSGAARGTLAALTRDMETYVQAGDETIRRWAADVSAADERHHAVLERIVDARRVLGPLLAAYHSGTAWQHPVNAFHVRNTLEHAMKDLEV